MQNLPIDPTRELDDKPDDNLGEGISISSWQIREPLSAAEQIKYLDDVCAAIRKEKLLYLQTPLALQTTIDSIKDYKVKKEVAQRLEAVQQAWAETKSGQLSGIKYSGVLRENATSLYEVLIDPKIDIFNRYDKQRQVKSALMTAAEEIRRAKETNDLARINQIEDGLRLNAAKICKLAQDIQEIRAGIKTKYDKLIESHVPLVISLINKKINPKGYFDDVTSAGIQGLMIAVENFNPKAGVQFSTYASNWIIQCGITEFKRLMNPIRIPDDVILSQKRIDAAISQLGEQGFKNPSFQQVAKLTGMTVEDIARVRSLRSSIISLDMSLDNSGQKGRERALRDLISEDGFVGVAKSPVEQDLLKEIFTKLPLLYTPRQIQYLKAFCKIEVDEDGNPTVVETPVVKRANFRDHWGFSAQMANIFGRQALTVIGSIAHLQWVSHAEILSATKSRISPQALEVLLNICRETPKNLNELISSPFIYVKFAPGVDVSKNNKKGQEFLIDLLRELGRDLVWITSSYLTWSSLSAGEKISALGDHYSSPAGRLFLKYFDDFNPGFDNFAITAKSYLRREGFDYSVPQIRFMVESLGAEIFKKVRPYQP